MDAIMDVTLMNIKRVMELWTFWGGFHSLEETRYYLYVFFYFFSIKT